MVRKPLVAGNWKMNGLRRDLDEAVAIAAAARAGQSGRADVLLCPPATLLMAAVAACPGIALGGQDCAAAPAGADTGEISAEMLADAGARFVILGHSERRAMHGETDAVVREKIVGAQRAGLAIVLCVGETQAERAAGRAQDIVAAQLRGSLPPEPGAGEIVVAYEPIWAIGTGATPTLEDVAAMHAALRGDLAALMPARVDGIRILYGGSVKPANAATLLAVDDVDGALVGGASLKASEFMAIAAAYL